MGKTTGANSANLAPSRPPRIKAQRELKTLSGLSQRMMTISDQDDMKSFRADLLGQIAPELRPSLLLFFLSDLPPEELAWYQRQDCQLLEQQGLSPELSAVTNDDLVIANYLASAQRLASPGLGEEIKAKIFADIERSLESGGSTPEIDLGLLEIMIAARSPDRHQQQLSAALTAAHQRLSDHGISVPDIPVVLMPPALSALVTNYDLQPANQSYLRSARFYRRSQVIVVADDRQVISESLLLHELIHAIQHSSDPDQPEYPEDQEQLARGLNEALTERAVADLTANQYYLDHRQNRILANLESSLGADYLDQLQLLSARRAIAAIGAKQQVSEQQVFTWLETIGC